MSVNYTQDVRAKFGGYVGQIVPHASPYIQNNNDPVTDAFKEYIPAGYLKCDGSVVSAQKFAALASIIGVGSSCRFYKDGTNIREADTDSNDAGQTQLPDLGSKVIIASPNSVGQYTSTTNESTGANRVGPAVEILSNEGSTQLICEFLGRFTGKKLKTNYNFNSSPKISFERTSTATFLDIENFQGHAHNTDGVSLLNYTAQHRISGDGKDDGEFGANSGAYNTFEDSPVNSNIISSHQHKIAKANSITHNFQYQHQDFDIIADGVFSTLDLDIENVTQLDNFSSPFIIITYLIKF